MESLWFSTPVPCDLQSAQVSPHKSNSPLTALVALSIHVKDPGYISSTLIHGKYHESLTTLGVASTCKLLAPLCSQQTGVLHFLPYNAS